MKMKFRATAVKQERDKNKIKKIKAWKCMQTVCLIMVEHTHLQTNLNAIYEKPLCCFTINHIRFLLSKECTSARCLKFTGVMKSQ